MMENEEKKSGKALWYFRSEWQQQHWCMHALCCSYTKAKLFPYNVIKILCWSRSFLFFFIQPNSILCHHRYWLPTTQNQIRRIRKTISHVLTSFQAFPIPFFLSHSTEAFQHIFFGRRLSHVNIQVSEMSIKLVVISFPLFFCGIKNSSVKRTATDQKHTHKKSDVKFPFVNCVSAFVEKIMSFVRNVFFFF